MRQNEALHFGALLSDDQIIDASLFGKTNLIPGVIIKILTTFLWVINASELR
ncbi:hypothetical protein ACFLWY_02240 [Chloroflexota bacterium]